MPSAATKVPHPTRISANMRSLNAYATTHAKRERYKYILECLHTYTSIALIVCLQET